jgi:hypothetical protein
MRVPVDLTADPADFGAIRVLPLTGMLTPSIFPDLRKIADTAIR